GLMGTGAVIASQIMARLHQKYSRNVIVTGAGFVYAGAMFLVADVIHFSVLAVALLAAGAAWLAYFASISAAGQLAVPDWVRARGLSMVVLTIMGAGSVGAPLWGRLADAFGISAALMAAGAGLFLSLFFIARYRIVED